MFFSRNGSVHQTHIKSAKSYDLQYEKVTLEDGPFWLYNLCIIDVREFVWVDPASLHRFTGWNTDNGTIIDIKINLVLASVETRWSNRRCIYSDLQAATRSSEQRCGSIGELRTFTWSLCCPQGCLRGQRATLMEKWVRPDCRNCYQYQFYLPLLCNYGSVLQFWT